MARRKSRRQRESESKREPLQIGTAAKQEGCLLRSFEVGAVPLLNHFLQRMRLEETLAEHLPADDVRQEIPTVAVVLLLIRNVLISREPLYGVPEWAAHYGAEQFNLFHDQVSQLQDDRLGKALQRLFLGTTPDFVLAVVRQALREFHVSLDELHNDSTTITFQGSYTGAEEPLVSEGRTQHAITWGHNKDHRPDLKQLLFTLTLAADGGVPVYFSVHSGNTTDDTTHCDSWDLLAQLVGSPDFLYVADCKLASQENLRHIAARGGRFVTMMPATRREDAQFRQRIREAPTTIPWQTIWIREPEPVAGPRPPRTPPPPQDVIRVCTQELVSSDGFRLLWFHSVRKAAHDELARSQRVARATKELTEVSQRLASPRTRYRERMPVETAVGEIVKRHRVDTLLDVTVREKSQETFRQSRRGRPSKEMTYVREVTCRYELEWKVNSAAWLEEQRDDGLFPLLTNARAMSPLEVLQAYKRQPTIEKRFSQLKTDFAVTPVFLKNPQRIQGLLTVYFLAFLLQTLIERELRLALEAAASKAPPKQRREAGSLPLYPEGRPCRRPTCRRILDVLESIQRHWLARPNGDDIWFDTELTPRQIRLVRLLGLDPTTYAL